MGGKESAAPTGQAHAQPGAPAQKKESSAPNPSSSSKRAPAQVPGGCVSWGCKAEAKRFNFCDEHYDHFKFGLVKKTGEPVPDYEKKIEHYAALRAREKKVA